MGPVIVIDTREQLPYAFAGVDTVGGSLRTGDYSLRGYEGRVSVERKSKEDAYGCVGRERARFVRCLGRLSKLHRGIVVIEADLADFAVPPARTKVTAASAVGSYVSWGCQFNVPILWGGSREYAERVTYRFLMSYWKHFCQGGVK